MAEPFRSSRHDRQILVADWMDAEELAAWHMRTVLGITGTALTGSGTDAGLDVTGDGAAAQVKHHQGAVGGPDVQRLRGAAHGQTALFYTLHGYTRAGVEAADATGLALFSYTVYGDVEPLNAAARSLVARSTGAAVEPAPEEDLPLSVALAGVATLTEAQERDLEVFVVSQLAELLLTEVELPDSCFGETPKGADWFAPLPLVPRWESFYKPVLDLNAGLRDSYRGAVSERLAAPGWVRLIEQWWQKVHESLSRVKVLAEADEYTTTAELERELASGVVDPRAGIDHVLDEWDDRRPTRLSNDVTEWGRRIDEEALRTESLWTREGIATTEWSDLGVHDEDEPGGVNEYLYGLRRVRPLLAYPPLGLSTSDVLVSLDEAIKSRRFHSGSARARF